MLDSLAGSTRHWLPALAGMVCLGLGAGLVSTYGFFTEHLSQEFEVGVATLNLAPVALLLVPGLVAPVVGRLADRVPIRRLLLAGATFAMVSLFLVSRSPTLALAGLGFVGFAVGLTCYGPVVVNSMLVKHFRGEEARALAIAAIGISVATAILPPVVGQMLAKLDWRQTLGTLAVALLALLWLVVLAGMPAQPAAVQPVTADEKADSDARAFYRDTTFWFIGLGIAIGFNVAMVLAICYPPHFMAEGFSPQQAGWFLSFAGLCGLGGKTLMAVIGESLKERAKLLVAGLLLLQMLGLLILLLVESVQGVLLAMAFAGGAGGAFLPMHAYINSRYYPAEQIGQITGAQMPLFLPFALLGPPLAGLAFDASGSYRLVLLCLVVALLLAVLLLMLLPKPRVQAPTR